MTTDQIMHRCCMSHNPTLNTPHHLSPTPPRRRSQVQYVAAEDIPAEVFEREKQIEMGREDLQSKPEAIRAKIAEGRVAKLAQEMALLPQAYLMDNSKTVEQAVKEAIAAIGEKISIRRFVRFQLGEGIEKKVNDLAADVAAMTAKSA